MIEAIRRTSDGLRIRVKVIPGARKEHIGGCRLDAKGRPHLVIKVRQPPDDGKANAAIIQVLRRTLGLPKSRFSIVLGMTSRTKTIAIAQAGQPEEDQLLQLLRNVQ